MEYDGQKTIEGVAHLYTAVIFAKGLIEFDTCPDALFELSFAEEL